MVDRTKLVTAAQYYAKDGNEGLVEIGGERDKAPRARKAGPEPKLGSIPPWSKQSMETNADEVKKTPELIQQGKEEAEMFVGNNTRERNGKARIETMLQEYLQKLDKVIMD